MSQEGGNVKGLDLISGNVVRIAGKVKLPHIGWNTINIVKPSFVLNEVKDGSYMYFVHSYVAKPEDNDIFLSYTEYGCKFPSVIAYKNIYATQFHPEKSGETGLTILKNFVNIVRR